MRVYSWMAFNFKIEGYNRLLFVFLNLCKSGRNDLQNGTEGVLANNVYLSNIVFIKINIVLLLNRS